MAKQATEMTSAKNKSTFLALKKLSGINKAKKKYKIISHEIVHREAFTPGVKNPGLVKTPGNANLILIPLIV